MSQTARAQSAVRVEHRANRRSDRAWTRRSTVCQADAVGHLYQRLWREMDRAQKAYLNTIAEQENATDRVAGSVDAAYQRYDLATRAFNHFLKATAA